MKLNCPYSGITYSCEYITANASLPHPALSMPLKKLMSQLSLFQKQELNAIETHLLFIALLRHTNHIVFSAPLMLTDTIAQYETAQMLALAKLTCSGCFQKSSIELPAFHISTESQDISNIISVWEEQLEDYRVSAMLAKQEHEVRSMLTRVQRAFANPLAKSRKQIICAWMHKVVSLPTFGTLHPISQQTVSIRDYWTELLCNAIDGKPMLAYPEKDLYEFKQHLEEHLPLNYAQEFSLLEEIQMAITRKQNYFGYSFIDSNDNSFAIEEVKPALKRADFASITDYLAAIKLSRKA